MDRMNMENVAELPLSSVTSWPESSLTEAERLEIGPKVGLLASKLRMKQTKIAEGCGISRISINRFFRGRSEIRASDLVRVLDALGIDLHVEIERRLMGSF